MLLCNPSWYALPCDSFVSMSPSFLSLLLYCSRIFQETNRITLFCVLHFSSICTTWLLLKRPDRICLGYQLIFNSPGTWSLVHGNILKAKAEDVQSDQEAKESILYRFEIIICILKFSSRQKNQVQTKNSIFREFLKRPYLHVFDIR